MSKGGGGIYPEPLVIPPLRPPHKQSLIVLHGRGSNGWAFGPELLAWHVVPSSNSNPVEVGSDLSEAPVAATLCDLLPHAAFIFPTAAPRRAALFNRAVKNQWFDNWHLKAPNTQPELMVQGLRESATFVQTLVQEEVRKVGSQNVALGGLSQGCATMLATLLLGSGEVRLGAKDGVEEEQQQQQQETSPGAFFGMCGWMPFAELMEEELGFVVGKEAPSEDNNEPDVFEKDEEQVELAKMAMMMTPLGKIRALLRSELDLPEGARDEKDSLRPVFLGHGAQDDLISIDLGRQAARCLEAMELNVQWKEYAALGHWYSQGMLHDIVVFLQDKLGWEIEWDAKSEK